MISAIGVTPRQKENGSVPESTHPDSERSSEATRGVIHCTTSVWIMEWCETKCSIFTQMGFPSRSVFISSHGGWGHTTWNPCKPSINDIIRKTWCWWWIIGQNSQVDIFMCQHNTTWRRQNCWRAQWLLIRDVNHNTRKRKLFCSLDTRNQRCHRMLPPSDTTFKKPRAFEFWQLQKY